MGLIGPDYVVGPTNGGKIMGYNNITNAGNTPVAPINPQRKSLTFINPGTNTIYISPTIAVSFATINISSSNEPQYTQALLVPTLVALGGTIPILPGGIWTITGECGRAWQALAATGTTNPLTVIDSNV